MSSSTEDKSHKVLAVTMAFVGFSLGSVVVRIFTRLRLVKCLGRDDILIAFAELGAIAMLVGIIFGTNYGLGKHIKEQKPEWRKPYQQSMLVASMTYTIAAMLVRLSLLFFYLRIIQNGIIRHLTYIMIAISIAFGIGSGFAVVFQCIPLKMLWDQTAKGSCFDVVTFYFANAGIHILTEFIICVLPIPTLWKLHLPTRQKLGLCGLMGIGVMLIGISCYRIATLKDLLHSTNITSDIVNPLLWYSIELNLAIFIACGPAFLAFFRHYIPGVFGGSSSRTKPSYASHKNSYALRSVGHASRRHERITDGIETTVTVAKKTGTSWYGEENGSEEMIMGAESGIQKQVDVWVVNEDMDVGKADTRSNKSEQDGIAQAV